MIRLMNKESGAEVGRVSEEDLQFLIEQLEEEDDEDNDYHITADTIDLLSEEGASPQLVQALRKALGNQDEIDLQWSRV